MRLSTQTSQESLPFRTCESTNVAVTCNADRIPLNELRSCASAQGGKPRGETAQAGCRNTIFAGEQCDHAPSRKAVVDSSAEVLCGKELGDVAVNRDEMSFVRGREQFRGQCPLNEVRVWVSALLRFQVIVAGMVLSACVSDSAGDQENGAQPSGSIEEFRSWWPMQRYRVLLVRLFDRQRACLVEQIQPARRPRSFSVYHIRQQ